MSSSGKAKCKGSRKSAKEDGSQTHTIKQRGETALNSPERAIVSESSKETSTTDRSAKTVSQGSSKTHEETFIAYVHELSPVKRNKRNTVDYSTLVLQASDRNVQGLLYSKSKRQLLENSQASRTPIKIQRFTHTDDGQKVIINDMTKILVPDASEYCFQFKQPAQTSLFTIEHITECSNEWDIVTFRGKAVHIGETETTIAKKLKLAKSKFVDKTGIIDLDLWEQFIEPIKKGSVYEVSRAQVRIWNGKKKLSTTLQSTVTEVKDDSLAQISFSPGEVEEIDHFRQVKVPNIYSVHQVQRNIHCVNCSKRIIQVSAVRIVHCDRCGHSMRA